MKALWGKFDTSYLTSKIRASSCMFCDFETFSNPCIKTKVHQELIAEGTIDKNYCFTRGMAYRYLPLKKLKESRF